MIKEVDGRNLQGREGALKSCTYMFSSIGSNVSACLGLPHEAVAKLMAERFARRDSADMTLVVMDHIIKSGEKRKMRRYP